MEEYGSEKCQTRSLDEIKCCNHLQIIRMLAFGQQRDRQVAVMVMVFVVIEHNSSSNSSIQMQACGVSRNQGDTEIGGPYCSTYC